MDRSIIHSKLDHPVGQWLISNKLPCATIDRDRGDDSKTDPTDIPVDDKIICSQKDALNAVEYEEQFYHGNTDNP